MPDTFQDAKERTWELSLTFGDIRRVQKLTGTNLTLVLERQLTEEELSRIKLEEAPAVLRLQHDDLFFLDIILALIEPQLKESGVSQSEFEECLPPDYLAKVKPIFWRLYYDFFQRSGDKAKQDLIRDVLPLWPEEDQDEGKSQPSAVAG